MCFDDKAADFSWQFSHLIRFPCADLPQKLVFKAFLTYKVRQTSQNS